MKNRSIYIVLGILLFTTVATTSSLHASVEEMTISGKVVTIDEKELVLKAITQDFLLGGSRDFADRSAQVRARNTGIQVISISLTNPYTGKQETPGFKIGDEVTVVVEADADRNKYALITADKDISFQRTLTTW